MQHALFWFSVLSLYLVLIKHTQALSQTLFDSSSWLLSSWSASSLSSPRLPGCSAVESHCGEQHPAVGKDNEENIIQLELLEPPCHTVRLKIH